MVMFMNKKYVDEKGAKIRKSIHPMYLKLMNKIEKIEPEIINPERLEEIKGYIANGKRVSFCANHTNAHDIEVAAKALDVHFYVMVALEGLRLIEKIALYLNGAIFIKRDNKESRKNAQEKYVLAQKLNIPTLIYPEATWNTNSEKYINKLFNGAINASKESDSIIIPLIFEYMDDNKCYVYIGDDIIVDKNRDSRIQSDELRDIMTNMKFDLLSKKTDVSPQEEILKKIEFIADNWDNLPDNKIEELTRLRAELLNLKKKLKEDFDGKIDGYFSESNLDRSFEKTCVYRDDACPEDVFSHLKLLEKNPKARFLFDSSLY